MKTLSTRNLHVPLPDPIYRRLRTEALRSKRPATEIAREAIDSWLDEQQRIFVHESVLAYALEAAGTEADLNEELEAEGIECLLAIDSNNLEEQHR